MTSTRWTNSDSLKMIYHAKHDPLKAVDSFKEHIAWRATKLTEPRPPQVSQLANSTFLFSLGKDKQFRPIVYIRLQVMKNKSAFGLDESITYENIDKAIDWYLCLVRQCCFRKYFIENWVMILDCEGLSVFGFPAKFFTQLMKIMQLNHAATMHKMFILNPPTGFGAIFSAAKGFMSPDTIEKINMLSKNEFSQIQEVIDPKNLLEEYGGTLKIPQTSWPPIRILDPEAKDYTSLRPQNKNENHEDVFIYQPNLRFSLEHPKRTTPKNIKPLQKATDFNDATGDPLNSPSKIKHLATETCGDDHINIELSKEARLLEQGRANIPQSLLEKPASTQGGFSRSPDHPNLTNFDDEGGRNVASPGRDKQDTSRSIIDPVTIQAVRLQPGIQNDPLGLFSQEIQGLNAPNRPVQQQHAGLEVSAGRETFASHQGARRNKQKSWCATCCEQCNLI